MPPPARTPCRGNHVIGKLGARYHHRRTPALAAPRSAVGDLHRYRHRRRRRAQRATWQRRLGAQPQHRTALASASPARRWPPSPRGATTAPRRRRARPDLMSCIDALRRAEQVPWNTRGITAPTTAASQRALSVASSPGAVGRVHTRGRQLVVEHRRQLAIEFLVHPSSSARPGRLLEDSTQLAIDRLNAGGMLSAPCPPGSPWRV